jgi:hypothetical protein
MSETTSKHRANPIRRQWLVTRIHDLGPRVCYELICEIERYGVAGLDRRLERYAALDRELLEFVGADRVVVLPLHLVDGAGEP